jgi:hypothetical protein
MHNNFGHKYKKCQEKRHGIGNLEARELVSDSITALSPSNCESCGAETTEFFVVYTNKKEHEYQLSQN